MSYLLRHCLLFLLLFWAGPLFAQPIPYRDCLDIGECWALKLTPSSLLDPLCPILPLSVEYFFSNKGSIQLGFAYPSLHVLEAGKKVGTELLLKLELKQFFKTYASSRHFIGGEVFYRQHKGSGYNYLGQCNNDRINFGAGVFVGCSHKLYRNFFLEWHIGSGLLHYENPPITRTASQYNIEPTKVGAWDEQFNLWHKSGIAGYPAFALNISYLIGKKL